MAKSSSVVAGIRETMRRAGAAHGDGIAGIVHDADARCRRPACRQDGDRGEQPAEAVGEVAVERRSVGNRNRPSPEVGGWAMSDGRGPSSAPPTLPRGCSWWRERRGLLASGLRSPSRFPSGVVSEVPAVGAVPVTVAGPRRIFTGFRASPFACFNCSAAGQSIGCAPGRKSRLELRLERERSAWYGSTPPPPSPPPGPRSAHRAPRWRRAAPRIGGAARSRWPRRRPAPDDAKPPPRAREPPSRPARRAATSEAGPAVGRDRERTCRPAGTRPVQRRNIGPR